MSYRRIALSVLLPLMAVIAWCGIAFARQLAPTVIGPYRAFFSTCAAIPKGADSAATIAAMRGFVLARPAGNRLVDDGLMARHPAPTPTNSEESSYLFYPIETETANWCVVYLRNGAVSRTDLLPD